MIKSIKIKNFKSLKNIELTPCKLNLLIGPNSSGKTNFLKAITFISTLFSEKISNFHPEKIVFRERNQNINEAIEYFIKIKQDKKLLAFKLKVFHQNNKAEYILEIGEIVKNKFVPTIFAGNKASYVIEEFGIDFPQNIEENLSYVCVKSDNQIQGSYCQKVKDISPLDENSKSVFDLLSSIIIFKPDISKYGDSYQEGALLDDGSNLPVFLYNLSHSEPQRFDEIVRYLNQFNPNIIGIKILKSYNEVEIIYLDKNGNHLGMDEVSDGILFFTGVLAKLFGNGLSSILLLEEPERSLHPRKVHDAMELLRKVADEKHIQIFITSHSPLMLNEFSNHTHCIFSFEMIKGQSKVKNIKKDVIDPHKRKMEAKGLEPIDYTDDLGAAWITGFLGGVPE